MSNSAYQRPTKLLNSMYILMVIISAITNTAFNMVSPVIQKYALSIGFDNTVAGTIVGLYSLIALVARPIAGLLSDRVNKKWAMAISTACMGIAVAMYPRATGIVALFVIRIAHGVSFSLTGTMNVAFANEYVPEGRTGEGIGYLGLSYSLAQAVGPGIGLALINISYTACFTAAAAVLLFSSVIMCFLRYKYERSVGEKKSIKLADLVAVELLPVVFFSFIIALGNGIVSTFLAVIADERAISGISLFFTVNAVVMLVSRPLAGKLTDKKGSFFIIIPSLFCCGTFLMLLGAARTLPLVIVAGAIKAFSNGSGQPAVQAECIKRLGKGRTGVATSTYFIGADVGNGIASIAGGAIADAMGYTNVFFFFGFVGFTGMILAIIYNRFSPYYRRMRAEKAASAK